ncbi:GNAT family N-acetyltransferase [Paenibacillus hexagrammi]|uniref:GNAT family N-acetyltransferase n=1 Tax=Paenibacillus hexagrammi TaxID=2908839 RepID=A0ABY3SJB3_9BACL|nr:GNAT family N-acetyltransferase [Paenibacillus sp. YPD9-1]UJF34103.1 GNAT family N-acetyltransferase [Paenibacillus sp. YPD9-1]
MDVKELQTEQDAQRITEFYLSTMSFDDQNHTPGELRHFRNAPRESLKQPNHKHWFVENEAGEIIAVTSCKENEHQSGGFLWDYLAVHREYRRHGLAKILFQRLEDFVRSVDGRYLLTYTCDLPEYQPIQRMFQANGFVLIGTYPDYYYDGEARLAFHKRLAAPSQNA